MDLTETKPGFASLFGFPVVTDLAALAVDLAVFGAPFGVPYDVAGPFVESSLAPAAVRQESHGSSLPLTHHDFDLGGPLFDGRAVRAVDCGDVISLGTDIPGTCRRITETTKAILAAGALPLMLGGDDSVPIPFFRAFEGRGRFTLVQIDAHLDWRDEIRGVREGYSSTMRRASEMPWIARMVQIGQRGVGSARPQEVADALAWGSRILPAREVHARGIDWVLAQIPEGPYIVTVDCDGIDPSVVPAVNAPVPGGLLFHQMTDLLRGLAGKGRVAGFDIVELAPRREANSLSANAVSRIVANLIGWLARAGQLGG